MSHQYSAGGCDSLCHKTKKVCENMKTQAEMETYCEAGMW
jgi:hypothetical protein